MEKVYPPYKKMTMFGSYVRFSGCSVFNDLFWFRVVFNDFCCQQLYSFILTILCCQQPGFLLPHLTTESAFLPSLIPPKKLGVNAQSEKRPVWIKDDPCC